MSLSNTHLTVSTSHRRIRHSVVSYVIQLLVAVTVIGTWSTASAQEADPILCRTDIRPAGSNAPSDFARTSAIACDPLCDGLEPAICNGGSCSTSPSRFNWSCGWVGIIGNCADLTLDDLVMLLESEDEADNGWAIRCLAVCEWSYTYTGTCGQVLCGDDSQCPSLEFCADDNVCTRSECTIGSDCPQAWYNPQTCTARGECVSSGFSTTWTSPWRR